MAPPHGSWHKRNQQSSEHAGRETVRRSIHQTCIEFLCRAYHIRLFTEVTSTYFPCLFNLN